MKEILGYINMKQRYFAISLLLPLLLASCGSGASFEQIQKIVNDIDSGNLYPYYQVKGMLDFNNEIIEVDQIFDKNPSANTFVPYARYNEGFYTSLDSAEAKADVKIYGMSSKSYFLRAPLRITKENFFSKLGNNSGNGTYNGAYFEVRYNTGSIGVIGDMTNVTLADLNETSITLKYTLNEEDKQVVLTRATEYKAEVPYNGRFVDNEGNVLVLNQTERVNKTCANYLLESIITSFASEGVLYNPSSMKMTYELLPDGGFAFVGNKVHSKVYFDNYPYYPDPEKHPEMGSWEASNPLPCYKNFINGKYNVRFEYNKDGWLTKEWLETLDYNYNVASRYQASLVSTYTYKFSD